MLSEVVLLLAACALLFFIGAGSPAGLVLQLAVIVLCIPAIRLVIRRAPPFVPTSMKNVRKMIEMADVHAGDKVYDLGCGDGRLLLLASCKGADAVGYELSVPTLLYAKFRTFGRNNIRVRYGDFWNKTYGDADVVFCYLLLDAMAKFEREIWPMLKPGCRVVSHSFPMPTVEPTKREGKVMVYVKA